MKHPDTGEIIPIAPDLFNGGVIMNCRLIADCRLTANSPPTESSAKPNKIWVLAQKFSRQLPSQFANSAD
jgi:hypothetical protein